MFEKMRKYLFSSFSSKLIYSYVLLAFFTVLIIGNISYKFTSDKVKDHTRENIMGTLQQIKDNIVYKQELVKRASEQLYSDVELQRILKVRYDEEERYFITRDQVMTRCKVALNITPEDILLSLYINNKSLPEVAFGYEELEDLLFVGRNFQIQYMDKLQEKPWFKNHNFSNYYPVWSQVDNDKRLNNITMIRKIFDFEELVPIGYITITIKLKDLFESVNYNKIGNQSHLIVADNEGEIIYNGGAEDIDKVWLRSNIDNYLVLEERVPGGNWTLKALVPLTRLEKDARSVRNLMLFTSLAIFVFVACIGFIISRYLSKNIRNTVTAIESFSEGNFQKRIHNNGNDEFNLIANAFNDMAATIDKLIKEVYISKLQKKEIELEFLQSQINPHFLYNTLSSMSQLSLLGANDKLNNIIMSLSKFYRLTLNEGKLIISIGKELEQINAYIEIQKIKYGSRFEVSYEIDESLVAYDTVKFILQPFIENIEEHAWFNDNIHIRIKLYAEGNHIYFRIIDNGSGMNKLTLERLNNLNSTEIGYGIYNVNQRIKLQYGERYGVKIFSRLGIGTVVQIAIPKFREGGNT